MTTEKKQQPHPRRAKGGLSQFLRDVRGVSALEYAILVGVIALAVGGALLAFGNQIKGAVSTIGDNLEATHATVGSS